MFNSEPMNKSPVSAEHKAYLKSIKKNRILVISAQIALLSVFFVLWEIAASFKWIDSFIFSQPSRILKTSMSMFLEGKLWKHISVTFWETVVGFLLSTVIGTLIAVLLWWNNFFNKVLAPYLVVLNSLPKTALAPILIVWLGNNEKSIIVTALLVSVIVSVITILTGFMQIEPEKIKLINAFGGRKSQILLKLIIPANIPNIISAMKINVGLSLVGVIVGEFLVAQAGLGYLIVYGSQVFKMDWVIVRMIEQQMKNFNDLTLCRKAVNASVMQQKFIQNRLYCNKRLGGRIPRAFYLPITNAATEKTVVS